MRRKAGRRSLPGAPARSIPQAPETHRHKAVQASAQGGRERSLPEPPVRRSATAQSVPVTLVWVLAAGVLVLTATTLRRSPGYDDRWSMSPSVALTSLTVVEASLPDQTSYVSRASVAASELARDTTYTFSYSIVMRASDCTWFGSGSVAVTVGSDGSLTPDGSAETHV